MTAPVSLSEAKAFLRVTDDAEDSLIQLLIDAAKTRVEAATALSLTSSSAAPLRLVMLMLVAHGFENREEGEPPRNLIEAWLAPYRTPRL